MAVRRYFISKVVNVILEWFIPSLVIGVVVVALIVLVSLLTAPLFQDSPVHLVSMDSPNLGVLCPGQEQPFNNLVTVEGGEVIFYYISVMDERGLANFIGINSQITGLPHPKAGTFRQTIPWEVPDLPPGKYVRVLAATGVDSRRKSSMVWANFMIGGCDEGYSNPRHRVGGSSNSARRLTPS